MNTDYKVRYPAVMTIAGSDSSGGAGIQADLKTFSALGVYGTSAITAITVQNTLGVRDIQAVSPSILRGQIEAVLEDIPIDAVKIGMLHNKEAVSIVLEMMERFRPRWIVLDPVMISTSRCRLLESDAVGNLLEKLFARVQLVTPNLDEAAFITGKTICSIQDMEQAGHSMLEMGCQAVLLKGGHLATIGNSTDILFSKGEKPLYFSTPAVDTQNTHGTGCTLSSAITAYLALGMPLPNAIGKAKEYITRALMEGADVKIGHGYGPVNHLFSPCSLQKVEITQ